MEVQTQEAIAAQAEQTEQMADVSYDQNVRGVHEAHRIFDRSLRLIRALEAMLFEGQQLPIITVPVSGLTDGSVAAEVDLNDMIKKLATSADEADELKAQVLGPLHSYATKQLYAAARSLERFAGAVVRALPGV